MKRNVHFIAFRRAASTIVLLPVRLCEMHLAMQSNVNFNAEVWNAVKCSQFAFPFNTVSRSCTIFLSPCCTLQSSIVLLPVSECGRLEAKYIPVKYNNYRMSGRLCLYFHKVTYIVPLPVRLYFHSVLGSEMKSTVLLLNASKNILLKCCYQEI